MTHEELKINIINILDKFPEEKLETIYDCLKDYENQDADTVQMAYYLNKILEEDQGLLERLAK